MLCSVNMFILNEYDDELSVHKLCLMLVMWLPSQPSVALLIDVFETQQQGKFYRIYRRRKKVF